MFKTTIAFALTLAAFGTASATELTNDSVVSECDTIECALANASIDYISAREATKTGERLVVLLPNASDEYVACNIADAYDNTQVVFIVDGVLVGC